MIPVVLLAAIALIIGGILATRSSHKKASPVSLGFTAAVTAGSSLPGPTSTSAVPASTDSTSSVPTTSVYSGTRTLKFIIHEFTGVACDGYQLSGLIIKDERGSVLAQGPLQIVRGAESCEFSGTFTNVPVTATYTIDRSDNSDLLGTIANSKIKNDTIVMTGTIDSYRVT